MKHARKRSCGKSNFVCRQSAGGKEEYSWQTISGNKSIQGETGYVILGQTSVKVDKN